MKVLGERNGVYFFAPRKKEDTSKALDRISEIFNDKSFQYVGITSYDDFRKNGYHDDVEAIAGKIDFDGYNLIIIKLDEEH